ncbi:lysine--tRNA ligase [Candidatus Peribacteria bacterium RIFCSPLOWO2_02_FULL_51_10]|nr:MAG: lysine--tRNA ligase [Candidatus Peribacteria bacterium RIFCSPHIGHO2_02_FULL_51_15]OGJ68492.1 MAG: lysine--tRNA ligase [Candidatus Peribacteria bacterium RIFCSPLOWO2_02_FULL_51_10]
MDQARLEKVKKLRSLGRNPYAERFIRTGSLSTVSKFPEGKPAKIAGRVVLFRDMGKLTFATLQDETGRLQVAFREEIIGVDDYKLMLKLIDLGDFIGVKGERFNTKKGEPTIMVKEWTMLSKALRQPPEKWHGVADRETAYRQRYLDLMSNRESFDRFIFRSKFIQAIREFYWKNGFIEVEIPVLVNAASGALATPFLTHHNALDLDVFLRIALETHQKECLVGGFDRTFSMGPVFRNEGMDPSHLQEFTMCEHYAAYWDYRENMRFTQDMFRELLKTTRGGLKTKIPDRSGKIIEVDFGGDWPVVSLREIIKHDSGIDYEDYPTAEALRQAIFSKKIKLEVDVSRLGRGNLIDQLYKKVSRPRITRPTFVTEHTIDLSPLARRNDKNPAITDRFQLVVGGWEIINAYSELIDPVDQATRFSDQSKAKVEGDSDAHGKDDEYVTALEYGCPPCSGWGMGIDRIVALLTCQENLKDVVLFPLMKPDDKSAKITASPKSNSPVPPDSSPASTMTSSSTPLLQRLDYGHLLPAAHGLLKAHATQTHAHLIATGAAMEAFARKFGGDPATWKVAGMLHDLDWDKLEKDYESHCGNTLEQMLKTINSPAELLADIRAHYAEKYGAEHPLDSMLRKCLYCSDELTGFIVAVALVRPSKKLADVEVKSVKKKLKDKAFAAQVNREQIKKCEELIPMPLDEFIQVTLEAMKAVAGELGL